MSSRSEKNSQIYIRGFPRQTSKDELKDTFRDFGRIRDVNLLNGYAFIVIIY